MRTILSTGLAAVLLSGTAAGAPVLSDDFSRRDSGWADNASNTLGARGLVAYNESGGYQMTPMEDETFGFSPSPRQAPGPDVRVEADVFVYTGIGDGAAGVVCRFRDHRNFYGFFATGDHRLMIVKVRDGRPEKLAEGRFRGVVPNVVDTRISAECAGDVLRMQVGEGAPVEVRDGDLDEGRSGLAVMGESLAGTSAVFDDFVLATRTP